MWWAGLGFLIIGWGLGFQPVVISWLVYWNLVGFPWETADKTEERAKRGFGWYYLDWEQDWER